MTAVWSLILNPKRYYCREALWLVLGNYQIKRTQVSFLILSLFSQFIFESHFCWEYFPPQLWTRNGLLQCITVYIKYSLPLFLMPPGNEASPQRYTTIHTTNSSSHAHWDLQPSKPCCGAEAWQLLCSRYKWWPSPTWEHRGRQEPSNRVREEKEMVKF